jgi:hypothetical protein
MNKTSIALSEALDIENQPEVITPAKTEIIQPSTNNDAVDDYNLSRTTFRNLIQQGNQVMEDMKELARQSESPRAYEVLATMMKTISDTTKDLYDLQKKTKELRDEPRKPNDNGNVTVERAVFVGTTSDLLKKIKAEKE